MPGKFGGNPKEFGSFFLLFIDHVYSIFYHHISGDSMRIYMDRIDMYLHAIWKRLISDAIAEEINNNDGNTNAMYHLVWFHKYFFAYLIFLIVWTRGRTDQEKIGTDPTLSKRCYNEHFTVIILKRMG